MQQVLPLGFSTLALSDHRLDDAVPIIAGVGFDAISLRLHRRDLNPSAARTLQHRTARLLASAPDRTWILEADGPYLLDAYQTYSPTLMDSDAKAATSRARTIEAAIEAMSPVGGIVTFSSGPAPEGMTEEESLDRFVNRLIAINKRAHRAGVTLAIRPSRNHLIGRLAHYERLIQWTPDDPVLLAADITSMVRGGELPINNNLSRHTKNLACVFAADLHEASPLDLPPGEGDLHWPAIVSGMSIGWSGPLCIRYCGSDPKLPELVFELLNALRHAAD